MSIGSRILQSRPADAAVEAVSLLDPGRADSLAVLTYHRVVPDADAPVALNAVAVPRFERQMDLLAERFRPITLARVIERRNGGDPLPARSVLVTFDDAYADFGTHAWPVLRARQIPVTMFVPTAFPDAGRAYWWDRLHGALLEAPARASWRSPVGSLRLTSRGERLAAFRVLRAHLKALDHQAAMVAVEAVLDTLDRPSIASPGILGWDELRALAADGVTLAAHTHEHPLLTRVSPAEVGREVRRSRDELRQRTGIDTTAFAYPSGDLSDAVAAAVSQAGIAVAFTTRRGVNDLRRSDWLRLRRINVGARTGRGAVSIQASGRLGPVVGALAERMTARPRPRGTNGEGGLVPAAEKERA